MSQVVAIVQARMGSSRLPNKSMLYLHGYPVIEWVLRRASRARKVDRLVFAIPDTSRDDPLAVFLNDLGATVFRGSETDVLARYYHAAREWEAEVVVRICADCPFISGAEVDRLIGFLVAGGLDYAHNNSPRNNRYPRGLGAEIASFKVLETMYREATDSEHREHVFNFVWSHPERFRMGTFDPDDETLMRPELEMVLDTSEDYKKFLELPLSIDMEAPQVVKILMQAQPG